MILIRFR